MKWPFLAMTAREIIDEVAGLHLKATVRVPASVTGSVTVIGTGEIPTGVVPWNLLREWSHGEMSYSADFADFIRPRIANKLVDAVVNNLIDKHPFIMRLGSRPRRAKIIEWIQRRITWPLAHPENHPPPESVKFEWINPDGTPYDLRPLEADFTRGLLGEGGGGYADLYGDLCGETDVTFRLCQQDQRDKFRTINVKLPVNRHVDWLWAEKWATDAIWYAFVYGEPYNNLGNMILSDEDRALLSPKPGVNVKFHSMGKIRWVHADGTPYDTQPLYRRFIGHKLSEETTKIDHVKLWVDVYLGDTRPTSPNERSVETIEATIPVGVGVRKLSKYAESHRYLTPNVIMDRRWDSGWWLPEFVNELESMNRDELFHHGVWFGLRKIEYYDEHNELVDPHIVDRLGVSYMLDKNAT